MNMIFPDDEWMRGDPAEFGLNEDALSKLDQMMKQSRADGLLIRNGRVLAEWNYAGPDYAKLKEGVQSCTKTITHSLMLGLALQGGLIPSLDAKVKEYWPAFNAGPHTDKITFRHLATMTSGMAATRNWGLPYFNPGNIEPGTSYHYHNDQSVALAKALTYLFGRELREVLKERVLDYMQADMKWGLDGEIRLADRKTVPLNHGLGYSSWSAADLAKIGHLYLAKGKWKDREILSETFVKESLTDIPFKINPWFPQHTEESRARLGYGLGWWTLRGNDIEVWYMSGFGSQFCVLFPEYGVVMTKLNDWRVKPNFGQNDFIPVLEEWLKNTHLGTNQ